MDNSKPPKSVKELIDRLNNETELGRFKAEPMSTLAALAVKENKQAHNDRFIYRFVVITLGMLVLLIAGAEIWSYLSAVISHTSEISKPSDFLIALGSTALGALAGLLAPLPNGHANQDN